MGIRLDESRGTALEFQHGPRGLTVLITSRTRAAAAIASEALGGDGAETGQRAP